MSEETLRRVEATRGVFKELYGEPVFLPSIERHTIFYYDRGFDPSPETLEALQALSTDTELLQKYPHHRVFVSNTGEVIGAIPKDFNPQTPGVYEETANQVQRAARIRGIELANCAIILTGPPDKLPPIEY